VLRYFVLIGCSETRTAGARLIGELSAEKHVVGSSATCSHWSSRTGVQFSSSAVNTCCINAAVQAETRTFNSGLESISEKKI